MYITERQLADGAALAEAGGPRGRSFGGAAKGTIDGQRNTIPIHIYIYIYIYLFIY